MCVCRRSNFFSQLSPLPGSAPNFTVPLLSTGGRSAAETLSVKPEEVRELRLGASDDSADASPSAGLNRFARTVTSPAEAFLFAVDGEGAALSESHQSKSYLTGVSQSLKPVKIKASKV